MTSTANRRKPGTWLVRVARFFFDEAVAASIVMPTIADLQAEVEAAGDDRMRRACARLRGYRAFWTLILLAPFSAHRWPVREEGTMTVKPRNSGVSGWLVLAGILGFTSPALTPWTVTVLAGGLIFAVAIHLWYSRHPILLPTRNGEGRPEINFSRVPVGGNIGGLIFMAGSMAILVSGLPMWRWFFGAAVLGGVLTAALVFVWHAARPTSGLPENYISLR